MSPVSLIIDASENKHIKNKKKATNADSDPEGCCVAVIVPVSESLQ